MNVTDFALTDSHAHLDYDSYDADLPDVFARAHAAGVRRTVSVCLGPEPEKWERAFRLLANRPDVALAVGVHPHDVARMTDGTLPLLKSHARHPKVAALGEIGLDYYYEHSPQDVQRRRFSEFLDLALEVGLPVSVHSRDAFDDTFRPLAERDVFRKTGGVCHCFTGTVDQARAFLDLGAYIGISGIVTFKKAHTLREIVKFLPPDRMLLETDAPFLAPEPFRGKRNEPAYVRHTAEAVAALLGRPLEDVARITSENAARLFRLSPLF